MAIIILIGMVYAIRALVRAGSAARAQRRAAQLYYERQRQQALQAARAAALREEYRQRQLEVSGHELFRVERVWLTHETSSDLLPRDSPEHTVPPFRVTVNRIYYNRIRPAGQLPRGEILPALFSA